MTGYLLPTEYPLILGIILLSGYFTFRFLDHVFGYYREVKYIDKLLEYALFGSFGFLFVYFLSEILSFLLNKPFNFNSSLIYFTPNFILSSLMVGCIYEKVWGYKKRKRSASLFQVYHKKIYNKGWVRVHLKDGQIFYGKLAFTDIVEPNKCIFSIKFATRLDKRYNVIKGYKGRLVFDMKNVLFIQYIKSELKNGRKS